MSRAQTARPPGEVDGPSETDMASDPLTNPNPGVDKDVRDINEGMSSIGEDDDSPENTEAPSSSLDHVRAMHSTFPGLTLLSSPDDLSVDPLAPPDHKRSEFRFPERNGALVRLSPIFLVQVTSTVVRKMMGPRDIDADAQKVCCEPTLSLLGFLSLTSMCAGSGVRSGVGASV